MIAKEDECTLETVNEAIRTLQLFTESRLKTAEKKPRGRWGIPEEFLCPISKKVMVDPVVLENGQDLTAIVLNLSIIDSNKELMKDNPFVISFLVGSLNSRTHRTRSVAAAALSELAILDLNRHLIGEVGAIDPLINVIGEGNIVAIINASSALSKLFSLTENRKNAIRAKATSVILQRIVRRICVDEMMGLLASLSCDQDAVEELRDFGVVPLLLTVLGEIRPERCENRVAILDEICSYDPHTVKQIRKNEDASGLLLRLSVSTTTTVRAQRKVTSIVKKIMKIAS